MIINRRLNVEFFSGDLRYSEFMQKNGRVISYISRENKEKKTA
jgi:hypothetical protein